tara:strand:- start:10197 stop:10553 length:357 start_codon:yes stop_codon:yes gene_type:complete
MIVIDLTKKNQLNESWLRMIGSWSKSLLQQMFGKDFSLNMSLKEEEEEENKLNFVIRGEVEDVKAYADALLREKDYLEAYAQFGKDHPMTNKERGLLQQAVQNFESKTGIKWPFSDED